MKCLLAKGDATSPHLFLITVLYPRYEFPASSLSDAFIVEI